MNANLMKFLALVLGFALWAALGYLKLVPLDPLIALLQMGLGGLITHMLQSDSAPAVPVATAAPGQGGFASPALLAGVAALALLAGCAGLNVSWVATATYNTPATTAATLTPGLVLPAVAASGAKP